MDLALACPPFRQSLSSRQQILLSGVTRRGLAEAVRRGELVRVRRGVYSTKPLPPRGAHLLSGGKPDPGYVALVRAALLQAGPRACAAGTTAAVLWGFDLAVEPEIVHLAAPPAGSHVLQGVSVSRHHDLEICRLPVLGFEPLPVSSAVQTVLHCAASLPFAEAVVVADSALRRGAVTRRQLVAAARRLSGQPGGRRVRRVVEFADRRSESVLESLLRVLFDSAGLPAPVPQYVILDRGRFLARVDLCWVQLRLVVEGDGRQWHDPADARHSDRRRDNTLEKLSWRVLRFTWAEVVYQPEYVLEHVRVCLEGWRAAA